MINIQEWKRKYPYAVIKIEYNNGEEELVIRNNTFLAKKAKQRKKAIEQLSNITDIYANKINVPTTTGGVKQISKAQLEAEERTYQWMLQHSLDQLLNPNKHKTKGFGNIPRSSWNRVQTEFECARDGNPSNFEAWRYKAKVVSTTPTERTVSKKGEIIYKHRRLKYTSINGSSVKIKHLSRKKVAAIEKEKEQAKSKPKQNEKNSQNDSTTPPESKLCICKTDPRYHCTNPDCKGTFVEQYSCIRCDCPELFFGETNLAAKLSKHDRLEAK